MGQGPYGPGPIWAPGPWAPGPSLLGEHLTKKTHPGKKSPNCVFVYFLETKKMRDVHTIVLAAVSRRDLCYVSENKGFRFAKNKLILCPFSEKMCQLHCKGCQILTSRSFLADARGNGGQARPGTYLPHAPGVRMT